MLPLTMSMLTWVRSRMWQQEKATVPLGSEIHLIERMLFPSPKVTFGSSLNGAFED